MVTLRSALLQCLVDLTLLDPRLSMRYPASRLAAAAAYWARQIMRPVSSNGSAATAPLLLSPEPTLGTAQAVTTPQLPLLRHALVLNHFVAANRVGPRGTTDTAAPSARVRVPHSKPKQQGAANRPLVSRLPARASKFTDDGAAPHSRRHRAPLLLAGPPQICESHPPSAGVGEASLVQLLPAPHQQPEAVLPAMSPMPSPAAPGQGVSAPTLAHCVETLGSLGTAAFAAASDSNTTASLAPDHRAPTLRRAPFQAWVSVCVTCMAWSPALKCLHYLPLQPTNAQEGTRYSEADLLPIVERMSWLWRSLRESTNPSMGMLFSCYSSTFKKRYAVVNIVDNVLGISRSTSTAGAGSASQCPPMRVLA